MTFLLEVHGLFLTESTVANESLHFLESGYFNHELGNTMPLAMLNAMRTPIVIISSLENHGIFRIDPENPITSEPINLAFNQYGVGHYDPAVSDLKKGPAQQCRCGVNKKNYTLPLMCYCCWAVCI